MDFLPAVVAAEHVRDYQIRLSFNDGLVKVVDFERWLKGPVFEPLKNPAYFQRFFVDGGTVAWPNGADIAPETLHREPGEMEERPAAEREVSGLLRQERSSEVRSIGTSSSKGRR